MGRKTLPGWLCLKTKEFQIFRKVGSSLPVDIAKLASRLRNMNYFSHYLFSLLLIYKIAWLYVGLSRDLTRNSRASI